MDNTTGRIGAGFRAIFYAMVDPTTGRIIGNTLTPPANGNADGSGAMRLAGATTAPVELTETERLIIIGDDAPLATFDFAPADLPAGVIESVVQQLEFEGLAQGTKVRTEGTRRTGVLNPQSFEFPPMLMLFQRRSQNYNASQKGGQVWEVCIISQAVVTPLNTTLETRANNPYRYAISANLSNTDGTGRTLTEADNGTTAAAILKIESDNPIHIKRWTGNNVLITFNLDYSPIDVSKTLVFVDGVQVGVASVDVTLKTVTLSVAPADGAVIVATYEFDGRQLT